MQLPPYVVAYPDLNLIVWKPRGALDENVVNKVIRFLSVQEAAADRPINRFSDTTLLEAVEVNLRYVFHVALYRRLTYVGRATARSAFLVDNRETAHYFKIHALLTDHSALQVRTFEQRDVAAKWLGVPDEFLGAA